MNRSSTNENQAFTVVLLCGPQHAHVYRTRYPQYHWIQLLRDQHQRVAKKRVMSLQAKHLCSGAVVYHERGNNTKMMRERLISNISEAIQKRGECISLRFIVHVVEPAAGVVQWGWQNAVDNASVFLHTFQSPGSSETLCAGSGAQLQCDVRVVKSMLDGTIVVEELRLKGIDLDCFAKDGFRRQLQEVEDPAQTEERLHKCSRVAAGLAAPDSFCGFAQSETDSPGSRAAVGALFLPWSVIERCTQEYGTRQESPRSGTQANILTNALTRYCAQQHRHCHVIVLAWESDFESVEHLVNRLSQFARAVLPDANQPIYFYSEQEMLHHSFGGNASPSFKLFASSDAGGSQARAHALMAARTLGWILRIHGISFRASSLVEVDAAPTETAGKEDAWMRALQRLVGLRVLTLQGESLIPSTHRADQHTDTQEAYPVFLSQSHTDFRRSDPDKLPLHQAKEQFSGITCDFGRFVYGYVTANAPQCDRDAVHVAAMRAEPRAAGDSGAVQGTHAARGTPEAALKRVPCPSPPSSVPKATPHSAREQQRHAAKCEWAQRAKQNATSCSWWCASCEMRVYDFSCPFCDSYCGSPEDTSAATAGDPVGFASAGVGVGAQSNPEATVFSDAVLVDESQTQVYKDSTEDPASPQPAAHGAEDKWQYVEHAAVTVTRAAMQEFVQNPTTLRGGEHLLSNVGELVWHRNVENAVLRASTRVKSSRMTRGDAVLYDVSVEIEQRAGTGTVVGATCTCPVVAHGGTKRCKHVAAVLLCLIRAHGEATARAPVAAAPAAAVVPPMTETAAVSTTALPVEGGAGESCTARAQPVEHAENPVRILPAFLTGKSKREHVPSQSTKRAGGALAEADSAKRGRTAATPQPNGDALLRWAVEHIAAHRESRSSPRAGAGAVATSAGPAVHASANGSAAAAQVPHPPASSARGTSVGASVAVGPSACASTSGAATTERAGRRPTGSNTHGSARAGGAWAQNPGATTATAGTETAAATTEATPGTAATAAAKSTRNAPPESSTVSQEAIKQRQMAILDEFL
eukprot:m.1544325 g.1544325  ORF g.1544325 m.1544325 type:complete len:1038 (-) comp25258_c0_seq3:4434-7547(-)